MQLFVRIVEIFQYVMYICINSDEHILVKYNNLNITN